MTQLTHEEIRDEVLSLFEEQEEKLGALTLHIEKIEAEGLMSFEKKVLGAKNRLINNPSITDDNLEKIYLEEIENIRKEVLEKVKQQVEELVAKHTQANIG